MGIIKANGPPYLPQKKIRTMRTIICKRPPIQNGKKVQNMNEN